MLFAVHLPALVALAFSLIVLSRNENPATTDL